MAEIKDIIVRITVEGDAKYLNALAKFEAANARRVKAEAEVAKAIERTNKAQNSASDSGYKRNQAEQQAQKELNKSKQGYVQLGQQVQDFSIQVQGGTSALIAFSQQLPQAAFVAKDLGGTLGKVATFLTGPWGTALILAVGVLTPLISSFMEADDKAKKFSETLDDSRKTNVDYLESVAELDKAMGRTTDSFAIAQKAARDYQLQLLATAAQALKTALAENAAAIARQKIYEQAVESPISEEGAMAGAIGQQINQGNVDRTTQAAIEKANALKKAAADLNRLLAQQKDARDALDKADEQAAARREREDEKRRRAAERAARAAEREAEKLQRAREKEEKPLNDMIESLEGGRPEIAKIQKEIDLLNAAIAELPDNSDAAAEGYRRLRKAQEDMAAALRKIEEENFPFKKIMHDIEDSVKQTDTLKIVWEQLVSAINSGKYSGTFLDQLIAQAEKVQNQIDPKGAAVRKDVEGYIKQGDRTDEVAKVEEQIAHQEEVIRVLDQMGKSSEQARKDLEDLQAQLEKLEMSAAETWGLNLAVEAINSLADGFSEAIVGTKSFTEAIEDMAKIVIAEITKLIVKFLLLQLVSAAFGGGSGVTKAVTKGLNLPFSKGGVIDNGNKITAYANGGVVTKPTIFPMANGMGLMAEAGPEAVMPLTRGPDGKLGVEAAAPVVNIHNYAGVAVSTSTGKDGAIEIELRAVEAARKAISSDIRRGGNMVSRSIEGAYGVGRGRG